jgi:hypothetical protein
MVFILLYARSHNEIEVVEANENHSHLLACADFGQPILHPYHVLYSLTIYLQRLFWNKSLELS